MKEIAFKIAERTLVKDKALKTKAKALMIVERALR
jgi:hypothetical protein